MGGDVQICLFTMYVCTLTIVRMNGIRDAIINKTRVDCTSSSKLTACWLYFPNERRSRDAAVRIHSEPCTLIAEMAGVVRGREDSAALPVLGPLESVVDHFVTPNDTA